eukprot:scaffold1350_cov137-Skeletonema_dohrnii-CCMP3373.AAC.12
MVTAVCPSEGAISICEREECGRDFCCCPEPSTTILQSTHKKSPRATIESSESTSNDAALSLESFNNGKLEVNRSRQGDSIWAVDVVVSSSEVNVASSFESDVPSRELQIKTSSTSSTSASAADVLDLNVTMETMDTSCDESFASPFSRSSAFKGQKDASQAHEAWPSPPRQKERICTTPGKSNALQARTPIIEQSFSFGVGGITPSKTEFNPLSPCGLSTYLGEKCTPSIEQTYSFGTGSLTPCKTEYNPLSPFGLSASFDFDEEWNNVLLHSEQTPTADRYPTKAPFQEEGDAVVASSTLSETINGSPIVPSGKARPDSTPSSKATSGLSSTQNLPELSAISSSSSTIESSESETTSKDAALSLESIEVVGSRQGDVIGDRPTSTVDVVSSETGTERFITSDGELSRGKKREADGSVRNEPQAHPISDVVVSSACGRFIGDEMFYRHEPTHDKHCRCLQCRPGAVALPEVHILAKPIVGMVLEAFPDWTYDVEVPRLEGGYITVPWQCLLFGSHSNKSSLKWEISGRAVIESVPLGTSVSPAELEELLTDTSSAVTSSRGK